MENPDDTVMANAWSAISELNLWRSAFGTLDSAVKHFERLNQQVSELQSEVERRIATSSELLAENCRLRTRILDLEPKRQPDTSELKCKEIICGLIGITEARGQLGRYNQHDVTIQEDDGEAQ